MPPASLAVMKIHKQLAAVRTMANAQETQMLNVAFAVPNFLHHRAPDAEGSVMEAQLFMYERPVGLSSCRAGTSMDSPAYVFSTNAPRGSVQVAVHRTSHSQANSGLGHDRLCFGTEVRDL